MCGNAGVLREGRAVPNPSPPEVREVGSNRGASADTPVVASPAYRDRVLDRGRNGCFCRWGLRCKGLAEILDKIVRMFQSDR